MCEEEELTRSHESYLQLLVKLPRPPEITLKAGNTTPGRLIPQKQAREGADIGCTFLTLHTIVQGKTMWYLAESGGKNGHPRTPCGGVKGRGVRV